MNSAFALGRICDTVQGITLLQNSREQVKLVSFTLRVLIVAYIQLL